MTRLEGFDAHADESDDGWYVFWEARGSFGACGRGLTEFRAHELAKLMNEAGTYRIDEPDAGLT